VKFGRAGIAAFLLRYASRLRFPYLFGLVVVLFVIDLIAPDAIPLADELLLGLGAILLGSLRKRRPENRDGEAPEQESQPPGT
jgi:hypothetical protein